MGTIPRDFDWEQYLNNYEDLRRIFTTRQQAETHYLKHGINEGRIYQKINEGQIQSNRFSRYNQLVNMIDGWYETQNNAVLEDIHTLQKKRE